MSREFWLGLALSVPIGIGCGLAVPRLQRWLDEQGKSRAFKRSKREQQDYEEAFYYHSHPHIFTQYLIHQLVNLMRVGVLCLLFGLGVVLVGFLVNSPISDATSLAINPNLAHVWPHFQSLAEMRSTARILKVSLTVCMLVLYINIIWFTWLVFSIKRLWFRVRYFSEYRQKVRINTEDGPIELDRAPGNQ